ncbi:MAG: RidA family protein [Ancalomicrobiaceae bacterium]|nr:RidA family protein [Ancalomicrobiaceae bacterium]
MHEILQPDGWAKPIGYANGVLASGRQIYVGGQIGWTPHQVFESDDLVEQIRQTLLNVVSVLKAGGADPRHIVSMTWYFVDRQDYLSRLKEIGAVYREVIGKHFPAMAAVQVVALMEDRAKVEIQATAVVPE